MHDCDFNHEAIHWAQEKELLVIGFYILYILEFFCRLAKYRKWHKAYRSISLERECYDKQYDYNYLVNRKKFAWREYW